jgi:aryl-alcohol dehydrogenase-like predicted oxidoreductase
MEYRQLGITDMKISEIGFGCMSLGTDEASAAHLIPDAIEAGFNFFDTADLYDKGLNEILLGKALRSRRGNCIIATKVGNRWRPGGKEWEWCPGKIYILEAVEESLKRLQTDYIDLYQLHGGTIDDPIDEIIETFELLKQQGKIRHYGISSIRPNVIREYARRSNIVSVMMQYSLVDRRPEETCFDLLRNKNISVLARGCLAKGYLVNKPPAGFPGFSQSKVREAADAIGSCVRKDRNSAQTCLQFVLNEPVITSAVVGLRTAGQLSEVAGTSGSPRLTPEELGRLRKAVPPMLYDLHR